MTVPSRVQRHRKAEADRRQVRTVNPGLIGKHTVVPRQKRQPARASRHRKSQAAAGLSAMLGALFVATGQVVWAVGAITSAGAGVAVAHLEYRRDLATVKRTGKPIGAKPTPPASHSTDGLSERPEPQPVDLDEIRKTPVTVHHRAGCPICARTDEHTHARDDWEAIADTWEYANPRPQPRPRPPQQKPGAGQPAHPGCQASAPRYCRCPGGPNRGGAKKTTTKRATTGARRKK